MVPAMSWLLISPVRMFAFKFQSFAFKGNEIRYIFIALAVLLVALGIGCPHCHSALHRHIGRGMGHVAKEAWLSGLP